ncbi:MAG: RNA methyltransferase [Nitrososphaeraceae archaeon]
MGIAIALVEPQYETNVGYIARIMKNFGYKQLYVINPSFDKEKAAKFATHGKDILAFTKISTFKELREKFDVLVGTTALSAYSRLNILRNSINVERLSEIIKNVGMEKDFCILLGRESSGLNNRECEMCDLVVTIDTKTDYRTMNISHALAILLYEISKSLPEFTLKDSKMRTRSKTLATRQEMGLLINYVNEIADKCGYDKHKQPMLNSAVHRLLARGIPTSKEVMLLVSLFRKSLLTIKRQEHPRIRGHI